MFVAIQKWCETMEKMVKKKRQSNFFIIYFLTSANKKKKNFIEISATTNTSYLLFSPTTF